MVTIDQLMDGQRLDRITAEARQVHFWRTVLTVIAAVLFATGWIAYKSVAVLWLALTWSGTAVRLGWRDARESSKRTRK